MAERLYPAAPVIAVGVVVTHAGWVLLVRRDNPPSAGLWSIPGGRVRLGETLQQAAVREILEETSLQVRVGEPVYTFDLIERDENGVVRYHYVIVDMVAEYLSGEPRAGSDTCEAAWWPLSALDGIDLNTTSRELLRRLYGTSQ